MKLFLTVAFLFNIAEISLTSIVSCNGRQRNNNCYIVDLVINDDTTVVYMDKKPNITSLHFLNGNMSHLPPRFFFNYPNLKIVSVLMSNMKKVTAKDLKGAANLEILSLNYNNITRIHANSFQDSPNLKNLQFYVNKIERIEANAFLGLKKLRLLVLGENLLRDFPEGVFDHLKSLIYVNFDHNKLTSISNDLFRFDFKFIFQFCNIQIIFKVQPQNENNIYEKQQNFSDREWNF